MYKWPRNSELYADFTAFSLGQFRGAIRWALSHVTQRFFWNPGTKHLVSGLIMKHSSLHISPVVLFVLVLFY